MTRAVRPTGLRVAVAVLTAVALSSCGGEEPSSGAPSEVPTESGTASDSSSASPSESTDPDAYLPVPEGITLTPQGTELAFRDAAVVAWEPRQDLVGVLEVTVKRAEQTTFEDSFQGWQLDASARKSTPYFVRATIENVGETDIGGRDVPLYAVAAADTLIEASSFQTRFDPCPGNGVFAETFGPGAAAEVCLVYLVPDGGTMSAVSFRPTQEFDPITWTGTIKKPDKRPRTPAG